MVREGTLSLEVRWIFPGRMGTGVTRWLGRFPAETDSREDIYLVNPELRGLSVKIRAGTALEVKEYCGSRGTLLVGGRYDECTPGHLEEMHRRIAGSELAVIEDASHLCFAEQPDQFNALVNAFLARTETA